MKKQRATHPFVCRLQWFGSVFAVAVSLIFSGAYGEVIVQNFPDPTQLNGIAVFDTYGGIGLARSADGPQFFTDLYDFQRTPSSEAPLAWPFFVGFDIQRDLDLIGDSNDQIVGVVAADGFGGVHTYAADGVPSPNYLTGPNGALEYNNLHPGSPVGLPYFSWDIVRDLELAADWRTATNAYQGYYILDGFGGVHYVNNAAVMAMIRDDLGRATQAERQSDPLVGTKDFFGVFGFRPLYRRHYVPSLAVFEQNYTLTKAEQSRGLTKNIVRNALSRAPYVQDPDFAKDLEVSVRFLTVSTTHVADSQARSTKAGTLGVASTALTTPVSIPGTRARIANADFGRDVAVTNGYYILSNHGLVHSMLEDGKGNPIPALWEDPNTGLLDSRVEVPYFGFDVAADLEVFPSGLGYALLDAWGGLHLVTAPGIQVGDCFNMASFSKVNASPTAKAPYFGFDIARDLKLVTYLDRQNYGRDSDGDGEADAVDPKHGKIIGYYVIDGFGTVYGVGAVAKIPRQGALPLYGVDVSTDIEVSPLFRPVTDSVDKLRQTVSKIVSPLYHPAADSI